MIIAGRIVRVDEQTEQVTINLVTSGEQIDISYSMLYFIRPNDPATEYGLPD